MGRRLAPVLAVCFTSKIEEPVLARLPLMYCRYIDDCFVVTSTQFEMDEFFRILNEQSQYIKLTREVPRDGWLPFLNTQINLSNGSLRVKWFRKGSSKNILIHASSAHPTAVKRAVIRNMLKTATGVCTGDSERQESKALATQIALSNGYNVSPNRSVLRHRRNPTSSPSSCSKIPLCIPFISDRVSVAINQCIVRAQLQNDVRLVNIPNDSMKKQLVRNRLYDTECILDECVICPYGKTGDCTKAGVVYRIECQTCHASYIGETGRMLGIRIKEHLAGKRRGTITTPLGKHKREVHDGNEFDVKCTILACEREISARKVLEAAFISAEKPNINNKNECISITSDLIPFISLCEL